MFTQTAIVAALAATASAQAIANPAGMFPKRHVVARQTYSSSDASETACYSAVESLASSIPTPPPALLDATAITDPCNLPSTLSVPFYSYLTVAESWYSAHSSELSSVASQCPDMIDPDAVSEYSAYPDYCSATSAGSLSSSGSLTLATPTALITSTLSASASSATSASAYVSSATGHANGTAPTNGTATTATGTATPTPNDAGSRAAGLAGVAAAAAGFLAIVAAL